MIIRKLEYLIALAREGHFGRAAEACHVSQPTLSSALRQLEAELGITILKRGQRYSGLTEHGERVLVFAQRMAVECEQLRRDLESRAGEALGTIQLGVVESAIPAVSALTIPFQKRHPHVVVKISNLTPAEIQQAFEEFKLDIAITYLEEPVRRQGRSFVLYEEAYSLLAEKSSALSRRGSFTWEEAAELPLCLLVPEMLPSSSPLRDLIAHIGRNAPHIETNSVAALYSHVRSGEWASVLPRSLTFQSQIGSDLVAIPLPPAVTRVSVGIMIPDRDLTFVLAEEFFNVAVSAKIPS